MDNSIVYLLFPILFLYFIPILVGYKNRNAMGIFILNLFLGWTFIGWVVALIWAVSDSPKDNSKEKYRERVLQLYHVRENEKKQEDGIINLNTKKCPFCAEIIKKEAIVCRFCKSALKTDESI